MISKGKPAIPAMARKATNSPGSVQESDGGNSNEQQSEVPQEKSRKPKTWHPQQEKLLKQWAEIATSFRWMHHNAHLMYSSYNFWFTLPVIVISSVTGTMNFAQSSFPAEYVDYVPLFIGALNLIAGIVTTVASYLRFSELSEGNRVAALMFGKLSRNIRVELLLPITERTMDGNDFIAMCRSELDRLTEQTPDIPKKIEHKFLRQFEDLLQTDFYPPELQDLHPVEIYREDPKIQRDADVLAHAALAFQKVLPPRVEAKVEADKPVEVVLNVEKPVAAAPVNSAGMKEIVSQELSELTRLQSVSSRISQRLQGKAFQARQSAVATMAAAIPPLPPVEDLVSTAAAAVVPVVEDLVTTPSAEVERNVEPFFIENP
jgi:hypothetical protein